MDTRDYEREDAEACSPTATIIESLREQLAAVTRERDALGNAINRIFEAVPPYSMDGSPTIPDSTVELVIKEMKDAGQKWDWE